MQTLMWALAAAGDQPAWRDPEWIKALSLVLTAAVPVVAAVAGARWGVGRHLSAKVEAAKVAAQDAAIEAAGARDGVSNTHGTHLRTDVDEIRDGVRGLERRLDTMATLLVEQHADLRADAAATHEVLSRRIGALEAAMIDDWEREHDDT